MQYEINETEFFEVLKINQIKTYSYLLEEIDQNNYMLKVDLNYYGEDFKECYQKLELPITLSENDYIGTAKLVSVDLEVIDAQGVNIHFVLDVNLNDDVFLNKDYTAKNQEETKEAIKANYDNVLEEKLCREDQITETENDDFLNQFITDYACLRVIDTENEGEYNDLSKRYNISLDELYDGKKKGKRLAKFAE